MKTVIRSNYSFILPLYRLWNELHSFKIVLENKLSLMACNMIAKEFVGFYIITNHIILKFFHLFVICVMYVCAYKLQYVQVGKRHSGLWMNVRGKFHESVLFLQHVDYRDQIQVIRLGNRNPPNRTISLITEIILNG